MEYAAVHTNENVTVLNDPLIATNYFFIECLENPSSQYWGAEVWLEWGLGVRLLRPSSTRLLKAGKQPPRKTIGYRI